MSRVVRFAAVTGTADLGLLTPSELERRSRLRDPRDRDAFAAAHVLVRECAGELLGAAPDQVRIEQHCQDCARPHGRPSVAGQPDIHVSLSHTRSRVAAAAAWSPCGVDVELVRPVEPIRSALTPPEQTWLVRQSDVATAFLRLWVRKEALVKAGLAPLGELHRLDALQLPADVSVTDWSGGDAVGAVAIVTRA